MTHQPLLAFHGQQSIKDFYLERVREHQRADQVQQSLSDYWLGWKGCAVGCTVHGLPKRYTEELGIPLHLAFTEDVLFETMAVEPSRTWPERFLSAIEPGADLQHVFPKLILWLMEHLPLTDGYFQDEPLRACYTDWVAGQLQGFEYYRPTQNNHIRFAIYLAYNNPKIRETYQMVLDALMIRTRCSPEQISEKLLELLAAAPVVVELPETKVLVELSEASYG